MLASLPVSASGGHRRAVGSTTTRTSATPKSKPSRSTAARSTECGRQDLDDPDVLVECYRYPAEHWIHLRTTNAIESIFATAHLHTEVTKDPDQVPRLAMAYKLIEAVQARWRKVNGPELVALVRAGASFHEGKWLERPADITQEPSPTEAQSALSEGA